MSTPIRHNKPINQRSAFQPYRLLSPSANPLFPLSNPTTPILNSPMQASDPLLSSNLLLQQLQQQQTALNPTQNQLLSNMLAKMVQDESTKLLQETLRNQAQSSLATPTLTTPTMPPPQPPQPSQPTQVPNLFEEAAKLMPNVKDPFALGYITGLLYAQGGLSGSSFASNVENMMVSRASSLPNMIQLMMGSTFMDTPPESDERSVVPMPILHPETTSA